MQKKIVIHPPGSAVPQFVTSVTLERVKTFARDTLARYKGFINQTDTEVLTNITHQKDYVNPAKLRKIVAGIRELSQSGLPPIYDHSPNLEGASIIQIYRDGIARRTNCFPLQDFIIQFGAGVYFSEQAERGFMKSTGGVASGIGPSSPQIIQTFVNRAMSQGYIDERVRTELHLWREEKHRGPSERSPRFDKAITSLSDTLSRVSRQPHPKVRYEGDLRPALTPTWYLDIVEDDLERMIADYALHAQNDAHAVYKGKGPKNRHAYTSNRTIFPQIDIAVSQMKASRAAAQKEEKYDMAKIAAGELNRIDTELLNAKENRDNAAIAYQAITTAAKGYLQDPNNKDISYDTIGRHLGLPRKVLPIALVKAAIDQGIAPHIETRSADLQDYYRGNTRPLSSWVKNREDIADPLKQYVLDPLLAEKGK